MLDDNLAYAIVDVSAAAGPDYTLAHEVGHLQGAQHHPEDDTDPDGLFSFGFGHRYSYSCGFFNLSTCRKATIMAFQEVFTGSDWISYPRIKHLSNPDVTKNGQPTGIAGERENWEVLRQTNNTVADFENPNELRASITNSNSDSWYNFTSHTCGGSGSLSYQWQTSYGDPFHFGTVVSTSSSYSVGLLPGTWYIRLTVSSSGQTFVTTTTVEVEESDGAAEAGSPASYPATAPSRK